MNTDIYNATGIAQTGAPMNQAPVSNPGIVYQPANQPTSPGGLKVAQQSSQNIVWPSRDGGQVNIGTLLTSPATTDGPAGIEIYDGKNRNNEGRGNKVLFLSDGNPDIIVISPAADADTPIAPFQVIQTANPSNSTEAADFASSVVVGSHFTPLISLSQNTLTGTSMIWLSDGTSPSGLLGAGTKGDICLNGPSGQPFYCGGGSSWTGM
jgi:hypothetical protein